MKKEDKAGLELTVIIHLVILIALLVWSIGAQIHGDNSFLLDFSKQETAERQKEQEELRQELSRLLEERMAVVSAVPETRNVAVNGSLRDDRNSAEDAENLYREAERLANDLRNGAKSSIEEDAREETVEQRQENGKTDEVEYSGPSVLSWTLVGRKASHLPIPAYRCFGAGIVTVVIAVDRQGRVTTARIDDSRSDGDACLTEFALRAARMSRFSKDISAPARQGGEIVYSFIAQ